MERLRGDDGMIERVFVPPIKIHGIKTKLVETISDNLYLTEDSVWYEPFMGSGVVGFNLAPRRAVFSDTNPYTVALYNAIKEKKIDSKSVREYLEHEGAVLAEKDEEHYYFIRDRFNRDHDPLDFLFLNRSCFNGMIRFNRGYKFNVPYGHKPERFSRAYVTKICNQVKRLEDIFPENDWEFLCCPFEDTIKRATPSDFIYCDPPYIGRHVDYYDSWDEASEQALHDALVRSGARFMLSTWEGNKYRKNEYIDTIWKGCHKVSKEHFYHVGGKEANRNPMTEALLTNYDPETQKSMDQAMENFRLGHVSDPVDLSDFLEES
jgi:DNA adenine methylase